MKTVIWGGAMEVWGHHLWDSPMTSYRFFWHHQGASKRHHHGILSSSWHHHTVSFLNKVRCCEGVWSDEVRCRDGVLNKVRCRAGVWSDEVGCCDGVFNKVRCRDGVWSDEVRCRMGVFNKVRCREGILKHGGTNTSLPQVTEIYFWRWRLTSWCRPVLLSQLLYINRQLDVQYGVPWWWLEKICFLFNLCNYIFICVYYWEWNFKCHNICQLIPSECQNICQLISQTQLKTKRKTIEIYWKQINFS